MNESRLKRKISFQQKLIEKQSKQIKSLESQVENLRLKCEEKDNTINSVSSLKAELEQNVADVKKHKEEYARLVDELKKMKEVINETVYNGRWRLIKFLIK